MNQITIQPIDSTWKSLGIDLFLLTPRINRLRFLGLMTLWYIFLILSVITSAIPKIGLLIAPVLIMITLINIIFLQIRRFNDFNFRGWWMLVPLFPYIACLIPGTKGPNRFGEQPPKASLPYILLSLLFPVLIIIAALMPNDNGITYKTKNFSIQFPSKYEVTTNTVKGALDEVVKATTDDYILEVETIDYSKTSKDSLHKLFDQMGVKSFAESLNVSSVDFIQNFGLLNENATDVKVISDKPIEDKEIPGRLIQLSYKVKKVEKEVRTIAAIYLDEANKRFYCVQANYFDDNDNKNKILMEKALDSFKFTTK